MLPPSSGNTALVMGVASTSGTSVNFYQTTRRNIPEDSHLHTRRREKLEVHYRVHKSQSLVMEYKLMCINHSNLFNLFGV
jgi:hypothetical protein